MIATPETDAAVIAAGGDWSPVLRAVAQRLERERNSARELAQAFHSDQVTLLLERDEAREAFRELWQSADAYLPACNRETIKRWRKLAGWEAK